LLDEGTVKTQNPLSLRLLEHDLRDQDVVRVCGISPGKPPAMCSVMPIYGILKIPNGAFVEGS
jgi:hypothetical protein